MVHLQNQKYEEILNVLKKGQEETQSDVNRQEVIEIHSLPTANMKDELKNFLKQEMMTQNEMGENPIQFNESNPLDLDMNSSTSIEFLDNANHISY